MEGMEEVEWKVVGTMEGGRRNGMQVDATIRQKEGRMEVSKQHREGERFLEERR